MLNSITSTFFYSDFDDRQVGGHVLQNTHFSNQVARGRSSPAEADEVKPLLSTCISICTEDEDILV